MNDLVQVMAQVCIGYRIVDHFHQTILVDRFVEAFHIGLTDIAIITQAVLYLDDRLLQSTMPFDMGAAGRER
jgi:hypothetical protein